MQGNHGDSEARSMELHLTVLGTFHAGAQAGGPIGITMKKPRALLAFLALHPRVPQGRDRLAALLWPDAPTTPARLNLRQSLFLLRRALDPAVGPIVADVDGHIVLDASRVVVDALVFQSAAAQAGREALIAAAELYRGDLLQGLEVAEEPFDEWLTVERERLRETAIQVLGRLLRLHVDNEQPEAAIHVGLRLLAFDPCLEAVHRTLMRVYAATDRRGAAVRQFAACAAALRREFGLTPDGETQRLHREIVGGRVPALQTA
ncbi:MAG: hypothetical protein FJ027_09940 [Candidatus Rokubacteria bacterium]|nr:hypothetical protein [Candidatus Rokubacteria bacterium]